MPNLPAVPETTITERTGVYHVGLEASRMGMIFREISNTDLGIDGYLEVVVNGAPIGLIAVQIKSGPSYIESPNDRSFIFRAQKRHIRYWLSYRLPVIVVIYDPKGNVAYWHYVQDFFRDNDEIPEIESVPIRILKESVFDSSTRHRLIEIASLPDSTAHAMLALRASRYSATKELLTPIEMTELYGKRKWLGEWLPLDEAREEILLHSALGEKGPAWYWFSEGSDRDFIPYLRSALHHPDFHVREEASLAFAVALGREAVPDLIQLINEDDNAVSVANTLASISTLTDEDRVAIVDALWAHLERAQDQPRVLVHEVLSAIALVGRNQVRERVVAHYQYLVGYTAEGVWPVLLLSAGCLWNESDLPELRELANSGNHILSTLAITAIAHLGERLDLELLVNATQTGMWVGTSDDRAWLSTKAARFFTVEDLPRLKQMYLTSYEQQWVADRALRHLSSQLDNVTLLELLDEEEPPFQNYAIIGLISRGSQELLRNYRHLLGSEDYSLPRTLARGLTVTGDWEEIDQLLRSDDFRILEGVAEGLAYVIDGPVFQRLFELLQNTDMGLVAGKSLARIGDEEALKTMVKWVLENPYERNAGVVRDIIKHIDRRLYCPIRWSTNMARDFTSRRYSVRRYDTPSFETDPLE